MLSDQSPCRLASGLEPPLEVRLQRLGIGSLVLSGAGILGQCAPALEPCGEYLQAIP